MINTSRTYSNESTTAARNMDMVGNGQYTGSFAVSAAQKRIVAYLLWFYERDFWLKLPFE